ncbi:hypothetical protein TNCV_4314271, partial [Trichonephila clavipes]
KIPEGSEFANDAKMIAKVTKLAANLVTKMMPTWLYRQDFAKFSLNRHDNLSNTTAIGVEPRSSDEDDI